MEPLLEQVAATIARHNMFRAGPSVGVAVSGGADSVCLLHVLLELAPVLPLRLHVLHLNHGLRGAESAADAEFVRDLAGRLGLPFTRNEANLLESAGNLEQAARSARLALFRQMIQTGAVECVATGHTRSDQAETVLFRFLRGSGTAGLAGIRPVTADGIVRPLLGVTRTQVEAFLAARGIVFRQDSTNFTADFARNRIRHNLLPELATAWNPAIVETLAQTAEWAREEEAYWEAELDRLSEGRLQERGGFVFLDAGALEALPVAVARRLVRRAIERTKGDLRGIDFKHIDGILHIVRSSEGHGRLQAPGVDVFRSFNWLRFGRLPADGLATRNYRLPAPVPGTVRLPGGESEICLELIEKRETIASVDCVYNKVTGCLDWNRLSGSLELRNWRPGDQYQPLGSTGEEKLKTLFQRDRIPIWDRRHWPVLTDGQAIVWSRRFGPAAQVAANPGSTVLLSIRDAEAN